MSGKIRIMVQDKAYHDYILMDVFSGIAGIHSRAMFGGYGFYINGKIFAIIADGKLYFKVGDDIKKDFEDRGSHPFRYQSNGKMIEMSYWEIPEEILDNKDILLEWIERSSLVEKKK